MRVFCVSSLLFLAFIANANGNGSSVTQTIVDCAYTVAGFFKGKTTPSIKAEGLALLERKEEEHLAEIPYLQDIPDTVQDAVILQSIRQIKDAKLKEKAKTEYYGGGSTRWKRWLTTANLGVSSLLWALLAQEVAQDPSLMKLLLTVPSVAAGILLGDYLNSEFHFHLDNTFYNSEKESLREMARDARKHHEDPKAFTRNTYLGRLSEFEPYATLGFLATLVLMQAEVPKHIVDVALSSLGYASQQVASLANYSFSAMLGTFFFASWHSTWTHQMAHTVNPPLIWRFLQRIGIALPPNLHDAHHKPPYDYNYSTQTGWWDYLRPRSYWQRRLRRYYEKTGKMPGTWIQDPRAIPEDIVKKLTQEYHEKKDTIPPELWAYAPKAYPQRVPVELKEALAFVEQQWRLDFIARRQREFARLAKLDEGSAKDLWEYEQRRYPWIFGPIPRPLDVSVEP